MLIEKLKRKIDTFSFEKLVIFDSFDGSNHLETVKGKADLVIFLSTIISKELLGLHDYSTDQSRNILTLMQVEAEEEPAMLMTTLNDHFESRLMFKKKMLANCVCLYLLMLMMRK